VYVNSEDGNAYELPQGNSGVFTMPTGKIFLNSAIGAAYTPLSLGADGKAYTQNNGQLFVIGNYSAPPSSAATGVTPPASSMATQHR